MTFMIYMNVALVILQIIALVVGIACMVKYLKQNNK